MKAFQRCVKPRASWRTGVHHHQPSSNSLITHSHHLHQHQPTNQHYTIQSPFLRTAFPPKTFTTSIAFADSVAANTVAPSTSAPTSSTTTPNGDNKKKITFSGIQPTGSLHLGNYLGAVQNWVKLSRDDNFSERVFCLVDLHAITVLKDGQSLVDHKTAVLQLTSTLLACGLSPQNCKIYVQSHVPQHSELMWLLGCHLSEARLQRMHHYKEKKAKNNNSSSIGLFVYPVLMSADILLYATRPQSEQLFIPVGDDQRQHLQLAQEVASHMNYRYQKDIFSIPNALYTDVATRVMSLRDGNQKMSKSDPNDHSRINMTDSIDDMVKKIKKAKADAIVGISYDREKRPEVSNLVDIYASLSGEAREVICERYANANNSLFKSDLSELLIAQIGHIKGETERYLKDPEYVTSVLKSGAQYAKERTQQPLDYIRDSMGLFS